MHQHMRALGMIVKNARVQRGLSQDELAERIGADARTILNIENQRGNPKMEILFPLLRELEIDTNRVFYPEMNEPDDILVQFQLFLTKCTPEELHVLLPICQTVISVLRAQESLQIQPR